MKMFLSWLPVFCTIWIGSMLCERVLQGAEKAICLIRGKGVKNLSLERVGNLLLLASLYTILGGMTLLALAKAGRIKEVNILPGLLVAGAMGVLHGVFLNKTDSFVMQAKKIKILNSGSITGMSIGVFFGIIIGIFASKIAVIVMGVLIPASVLIFLIVFQRGGMLDRMNSISAFFMVFYLFIVGGGLGVWVIDNIKSGIPCFIFACLDGLILGGALGYATGIVAGIKQLTFPRFLTSLTILATQREKICSRCYRYSNPFKSKYNAGWRTCEHCAQELGRSKQRGKVIFMFGNCNAEKSDHAFILSSPDLETKNVPIDVSEVYINTKTSDRRLLEKFITYIRNYPPKYGLDSVKIFYKGSLNNLGHLKNLILNNFKKVTSMTS